MVDHSETPSRDGSERGEKRLVTSQPRSNILTLDELLNAEVAIIRFCQQQRFSEEVAALLSKRATVN